MDICRQVAELRNAGVRGLHEYEKKLRENEKDASTLENLLCEGRAALMFLRNGWQVALRESPDLQISLCGMVAYAEVKRFCQKEQDKLNERAMSNPPDDRLVPLPNASGQPETWEQIADVTESKKHQYVAGFANILVVESDSESLALTCETAAHVYDERVRVSNDPRLLRLSGILLVNRSETTCGPIPSNVEFCRTEFAVVPLNWKLAAALNRIHLG